MPNQLRHLDQELAKLKNNLLAMSALVEAGVYRSITAAVQHDRRLAEEVLENEVRVNKLELEIDDHAISLLALQHPMAGDLRLITSALKINSDLERMGDLAANIARQALELIDQPVARPLIDIPHMGALVQSMVRKAIDAFVARDVELAKGVLESDDEVDNLRTSFIQEIVDFMQAEPSHIRQALNLLAIVRNLERVADHSTNIAEDVLFYVKGVDVRHRSPKMFPGGASTG